MITPGTGGADGTQDFELNLASIIDCLTVIIAFLLLSSSFVAYGALDTAVSLPRTATPSADLESQSQSVSLSVTLKTSDQVEIEVSGARSEKRSISRETLVSELEAMKSKYPGLQGVVLTAAGSISYRELIRGMDEARQIFPAVALGLSGGVR